MFYDKDDVIFFKDFGVDFKIKSTNKIIRVLFDDNYAELDAFSLSQVNVRDLTILIKNTDIKQNKIDRSTIFVFDNEDEEVEYIVSNIKYNNLNISTIVLHINEEEDENSY